MKVENYIKKLAITLGFILLFQYVNLIIPFFSASAINSDGESYSIAQYVDNNVNVYYLQIDDETENMENVDVTANNISITKDESKLNQDKVDINIEVPENTYTIILPDRNSTIESNITFEAKENGEYVFEFTDVQGNVQTRVVHVTNIQSRKETKVPKVTALNGMVKLESDSLIEYSLDNKKWEDYTKEISYKEPLYVRVKDENFECSIIKITISGNGELKVENTENREIKSEILTSGIGVVNNKDINFQGEIYNKTEDVRDEEKKNLFNYIEEIMEDIEYSFSSTNGEFEESYFNNNSSELTFKDASKNNISINDENLNINKIASNNKNIDYSVIYKEYIEIPLRTSNEANEKKKLANGEIYSYEKIEYENGLYNWKEAHLKYAYINSDGELISNIGIVNKAKEEIEKRADNVKYTKIVGDGVTFYILLQNGTVYMLTGGDNGTYKYFENLLGEEYENKIRDGGSNQYIILKLKLKNIINIYDSCTALTKDGKIVSLIKDNEEDTSIVQELQKQTDKYLVQSHLGLKDGKLYNFSDVKNGVEVTAGKIVKTDVASIGIYSEEERTIRVFNNKKEAENVVLKEKQVFIDVEADRRDVPKFVDIAEYRDSNLAMLVSGYMDGEETVTINNSNENPYSVCYAITKEGDVWIYIGGYVVDTKINLNYFAPTINYSLDNTKWTSENINLNLIENTKGLITSKSIKNENDVQEIEDNYTIEKNGDYTIQISDSKEREYKLELNVANIDKVKPNIVYKGKIENGIANIVAYDVESENSDYAKSGIAKIELTYETPTNETEWKAVKGNLNEDGKLTAEIKQIETTKFAYVRAIDNAGNVSKIKKITFKEDYILKENEKEEKQYTQQVEGHSNMPQTGQNRIGYLIIGFIIILSMGILIYIESYQKISNK